MPFWRLVASSTKTAVGLRLDNETIRVAVGYGLELRTCEPHTCACGKQVYFRVLHGDSYRKSVGIQQPHSALNDIIWIVIKRAQIRPLKNLLESYVQMANAWMTLHNSHGPMENH